MDSCKKAQDKYRKSEKGKIAYKKARDKYNNKEDVKIRKRNNAKLYQRKNKRLTISFTTDDDLKLYQSLILLANNKSCSVSNLIKKSIRLILLTEAPE